MKFHHSSLILFEFIVK